MDWTAKVTDILAKVMYARAPHTASRVARPILTESATLLAQYGASSNLLEDMKVK